jgi:hypothetical protein
MCLQHNGRRPAELDVGASTEAPTLTGPESVFEKWQ